MLISNVIQILYTIERVFRIYSTVQYSIVPFIIQFEFDSLGCTRALSTRYSLESIR